MGNNFLVEEGRNLRKRLSEVARECFESQKECVGPLAIIPRFQVVLPNPKLVMPLNQNLQRYFTVVEIPKAADRRAAIPHNINRRQGVVGVFMRLEKRDPLVVGKGYLSVVLFNMPNGLFEDTIIPKVVRIDRCRAKPETVPEDCSQQGVAAPWKRRQPHK